MAWCPHCDESYDAEHATLPCCGACGHPFLCPCHRAGHGPGSDRVAAGAWGAVLWEYNGLLVDDGVFDGEALGNPDVFGPDVLGPDDDLPI